MELQTFGYWVRRRRKALDLTQAALAHRVGCATITIKKIERDERRPSRTMAERFADNLMIPPDERESFVRSALGETAIQVLSIPTGPVSKPPPLESFDHRNKKNTSSWDRFVGRDRELNWLDEQLETALDGQSRVVFIAGDAGRGKTALMSEFSRRAAESHPDLLVSSGSCSVFSGIGDPYLPFREVMGFLSGDAEENRASTQNRDIIQRVWQNLASTLQVLVEHGPNLLDVFVPGKAVLSRAMTVAPANTPWLVQLKAEVNRRWMASGSSEQHALFGQFTNVLINLANQHPLLITLDDLHWADDASLGLFFHLARRLSGSRILILGTYRPEELVLDRKNKRHPLEDILREFTRIHGNISLDLAAADQVSGRGFLDSYLGAQSNHFSEAFHQALYRQTAGHPLFTVEFLHEMQARGELIKGSDGYWREAKELDWNTFPARVEAVIAQRLERLDVSLMDVLTVASVEGEFFTAEVIAQVLGIDQRLLLGQLSQQLGRRHRLIRARGDILAGDQTLSPYAFRHSLFNYYIYNQLDPGERRRLHGEVARALEKLYHTDIESIAAKLAWHFEQASMPDKTVEYLHLAGVKAIQLYGFDEAVHLLKRGLVLIENRPASSANTRLQLDLFLALGEAFFRSGQLLEALDIFQTAAALARENGFAEDLARAALGYEETRWRFNLPVQPAQNLLEEARNLLTEEDSKLKVMLSVSLARTLMPVISQQRFAFLMEQALDMARRNADSLTLYEALYLQVYGNRQPEFSAERMKALDEMLQLARSAGDRQRQLDAIGFRILENLEIGDIHAVRADALVQAKLKDIVQQPFYEHVTYLIGTTLALLNGQFEQAEQLASETLQINQKMEGENADGMYGIQMFTIRREQGRLGELAPLVKVYVEQHSVSQAWRPGLALLYSELGLKQDAVKEFEHLATNDFADIPRDALWVTCMAYLSEVCAYLGDVNRAAILYQLLLPHAGRSLVTGFFATCYGAVSRYLGLLATSMSRWPDAERHFQQALEMNERMDARPWLAHTQFQYAIMLLGRGQVGDCDHARILLNDALKTAHTLGMNSLVEKVEHAKADARS